jgi:fatty acid desaturase
MSEYAPGVCNIGKNEIRKRYALAVAAFVIAAVYSYAVLAFALPHWALLISIIPLLMGFEGFYQGYFHFCAGFAAAGRYDLSGSEDSKGQVTDAASHRKDLAKAGQIHLYSIISAIIVAAIIYLAL